MVSWFWRLESKVKRLTGLVPSEDWKGASAPGLPPSFCWSRCYWAHACSACCMPGHLTEKWAAEVRNMTLFRKTDDGRLCLNHLIRVWMTGSFTEQRGRESEEIKLKRHLSCRIEGDVFISSFLQSFIAGLCQIISLWAEQRHLSLIVRKRSRAPQGRLWCMIIITKTTKSKG